MGLQLVLMKMCMGISNKDITVRFNVTDTVIVKTNHGMANQKCCFLKNSPQNVCLSLTSMSFERPKRIMNYEI